MRFRGLAGPRVRWLLTTGSAVRVRPGEPAKYPANLGGLSVNANPEDLGSRGLRFLLPVAGICACPSEGSIGSFVASTMWVSSGQSLVTPHIERLPFKKGLALNALLEGCIGGQDPRVDFPFVEQQVQEFPFGIREG